jgi:hypothetical protein
MYIYLSREPTTNGTLVYSACSYTHYGCENRWTTILWKNDHQRYISTFEYSLRFLSVAFSLCVCVQTTSFIAILYDCGHFIRIQSRSLIVSLSLSSTSFVLLSNSCTYESIKHHFKHPILRMNIYISWFLYSWASGKNEAFFCWAPVNVVVDITDVAGPKS